MLFDILVQTVFCQEEEVHDRKKVCGGSGKAAKVPHGKEKRD
jgi:hypothetical protein